MNRRALLYLAITTCLLVLLLFLVTLSFPSTSTSSTKRLDYNQVRGSAVEYGGLPYTLNFEQQNILIKSINEAKISHQDPISSEPVTYSKIIVYRFNAPDIILTPLGFINNNLLFMSSEWNDGQMLLEPIQGKLKEAIQLEKYHPK